MVRLGWRSGRFGEREVPLEARGTPSTQEKDLWERGVGKVQLRGLQGSGRI